MGAYTEGQPFDCPHPLGLLTGSPAPSRGCPNDCDQRLVTLLKPHRPMLLRVRCIALFSLIRLLLLSGLRDLQFATDFLCHELVDFAMPRNR